MAIPASFAAGIAWLASVSGAHQRWNVCSVLASCCIEHLFDVK